MASLAIRLFNLQHLFRVHSKHQVLNASGVDVLPSMSQTGRNDLNVARSQFACGRVLQRSVAAHAGADRFRRVLMRAVDQRTGQLRARALQHVVNLGDLVVAERPRIGALRSRHHGDGHIVFRNVGEADETVVDRHARRQRSAPALYRFLDLRVGEIGGLRFGGRTLRKRGRHRQRCNERNHSNHERGTHDYSFASRASKRMFKYVMDCDCLMPCGTPGGMKTRSPALISRSTPPRIELPLNSPAVAPGFASTSVPPVATTPDPSRTTQTSVILPCCSAVSEPEMCRTLMLNVPPSRTRCVMSPFAVISLATCSSVARGRSIALSLGAGGAPAVCAEASPDDSAIKNAH